MLVSIMLLMSMLNNVLPSHPAESSENTAICAKIRKFGRGFEELLPAAILDQYCKHIDILLDFNLQNE